MDYLALVFLHILLLNLIYFKFSTKNSIISLISFSLYLLPFFRTIKNFKSILNIKNTINYNLKNKIWNKKLNFYTLSKKDRKIKRYQVLFLIIIFYLLLIPQYYSKNYVSYTIKYNYIHSIFLLVIQTTLFFFYKKIMKKQMINPSLKTGLCSLILLGLLTNLFLIFYCLFSSLNNIHVEIPFFSDGAKLYKFMPHE